MGDYNKSWILYNLRRKLHDLKSERPLIFNYYNIDSGKLISGSTEQLTLDELKDPNIRIAVADVDHEIARVESSIKKIKEELQKEKDLEIKNYKKTSQDFVNDGSSCSNQGKYREAIEAFEQAIGLDPNNADVFMGLGTAYGNTGEYEKAKDAFKQAVKIKPDFRDAYCYLALIYSELEEHDNALEACQQAIKLKPDPGCPTVGYAFAHFCLGVIYCNYGLYAEAIEAYKEAIKLRPHYTEAYVCLGIAYEVSYKMHKESIDGQMINLKPDYFHPYPNMNGIFRRLSSRKDAIDRLNNHGNKKGES